MIFKCLKQQGSAFRPYVMMGSDRAANTLVVVRWLQKHCGYDNCNIWTSFSQLNWALLGTGPLRVEFKYFEHAVLFKLRFEAA